MPQIQPIKEKFSNLLELASDGNCSLLFDQINRVGVILGKNQLDCWILENPTNSKLENWGCIPWIFYLLENVL